MNGFVKMQQNMHDSDIRNALYSTNPGIAKAALRYGRLIGKGEQKEAAELRALNNEIALEKKLSYERSH